MNHGLRVTRSNNGFPREWKIGKLERELLDLLTQKIKDQIDCHCLLLNTTWLQDEDVSKKINDVDPQIIVATNFVDPAIPKIFQIIRSSGKPFTILGNCSEYRLDFWAIACARFFKQYDKNDLIINHKPKIFLCYNRKPHGHRVFIANKLKAEVGDIGYVTLGLPGASMSLKEEFTSEQGIDDEYPNLSGQPQFVDASIRNDIYSLGNLTYWNDHLLNIVTETEFSNPVETDFFISEKTWKPIIGLRPFFVFGQPLLLEYLRQQGFDTFEDIISYPTSSDSKDMIKSYSDAVIRSIRNITSPHDLFMELLPRLEHNRMRFTEYAIEQYQKLDKIDIRKLLNVHST